MWPGARGRGIPGLVVAAAIATAIMRLPAAAAFLPCLPHPNYITEFDSQTEDTKSISTQFGMYWNAFKIIIIRRDLTVGSEFAVAPAKFPDKDSSYFTQQGK